MKSTSKSSKIQELKEEYKDENLNNSIDEDKEENILLADESEKLKTIDNNISEKQKSILKNISKNNSVKNINSKICTHNNLDTDPQSPDIKKHQRCVPLEIYTKVYHDKQTLINQVEILNKEINTLSNNNKDEEIKILDNKYKNLQREKTSIENILLNQEKYVGKLKKKIEKLEKQIMKKNEEIVEKDNNITELNDKIEELNNKIINIKQSFRIAEKKEIMKLNDKITFLSNEIEIKQSKIEFIDKRHKNLQLRYLKLLGDKRKIGQENIPILKYNKDNTEKDKDKFSEINNTTGSKYIESVKSYKNNKNGNKNNRTNKDIHLPEISQNKTIIKALSSQKYDAKNNKNNKANNNKNKKVAKNTALKDLNMLLSDFSEGEMEEHKNENKDEESVDEDDFNENEENEDSQG